MTNDTVAILDADKPVFIRVNVLYNQTFLTENYSRFLQSDPDPLRDARTEEALNIAITRARYSVALLYDEVPVVDGVTVWIP